MNSHHSVETTHVSFLDGLTKAARAALLERASEREYAAGEILWNAGDDASVLTLVVEGKVRIVRGAGGRVLGIHTGEAGGMLGEIPFFTKSAYPATAIAAEPTRCLLITHAGLSQALRVDPSVALNLLEGLSRRIAGLVEKVSKLSSESVQARLSRYLLDRISTRANAGTSPVFSLGMTQAALAEELGTVREVVVKSLRGLREAGAIDLAGSGRYRLSNMEVLRRMAGLT
jgi:CRP/FNR family transcriptional regulator